MGEEMEKRARDLLAAEFERDGWSQKAQAIRENVVGATDAPDMQRSLRAIVAALDDGWRPISTAPHETPVIVRVGGMTFGAILHLGVSMAEDGAACDQWAATVEGEHPPCWSDGACWASNVDEVQSLQPDAWRTPPTSNGSDGR